MTVPTDSMEGIRRWIAHEMPHPDGSDSVGELCDTHDAAALAFALNKYAPAFGAVRVIENTKGNWDTLRQWVSDWHATGSTWLKPIKGKD